MYQKWPGKIFPFVKFVLSQDGSWGAEGDLGGMGGGLAQGLGIRLFAFGGAYWPLATAHSDPLWVRTSFGCINGAPGWLVLFDYSRVGCPGDRLLPVPLTRCIQMHTPSPC